MCNAYNHSFDCPCGFGGDTGGGRGHRRVSFVATLEPISAGWAKDSRGTVDSYVNPNAHCPVCGAPVYFYRSPYDGRVFFDDLGWPWPKHPCTDNSYEPRRATRDSVSNSIPRLEPVWRIDGWEPLLSCKVYSSGDHLQITGDFQDEFLELYLPRGETIDRDSPVFVREQADKPDFFDITFLRSDHFDTHARTIIASHMRIAPVGDDTIVKAGSNSPSACNIIGQFILWQLDDPICARPYLERAVAGGVVDAIFDLAVIALMAGREL